MKLLKTILPEDVGEISIANLNYRERHACRAVVMDSDNNIAIMQINSDNYHKIPGGGIEGGETKEQALRREVLEEAGCNIEIMGEIGEILELRDFSRIKQVSYCYLAKVFGEKGDHAMTDGEKAEGMELIWIPIDEVIVRMQNDHPSRPQRLMMSKRDLLFVQEAKKIIDEK